MLASPETRSRKFQRFQFNTFSSAHCGAIPVNATAFKAGKPAMFPHGRGPQGDVIRINNFVRLVRNPLN
jgi:hypothetical protein